MDNIELLLIHNQTEVKYDKTTTIHQLFEEQVESTPENIAVIFENQKLTYRELNDRANQLAHYLIEEGVRADDLVAICVERSLEMMIGLLAVLKAGGAYVPLDPTYPKDRIAYMLENSNAKILLTQTLLQGILPKRDSKQICLDILNTDICSSENPIIKIKSDNLAYVIYTSGSTGLPKGVMIEHYTLVNFLISMQSEPGLTDNNHLLALTPISFDIHTLELYLPLITGAKLSIASKDEATIPDLLASRIKENHINIIQATPATWIMLLNNGWEPQEKIKILCGGEAINETLKQDLLALNGVTLHNMYGPTETTVWSTTVELKRDEPTYIGHPINNTQIYILDSDNELVDQGVAGELHIAGDGLARGYLGQPELTSEKFITNPFKLNSRMYKTGDLVRCLDNGNIEYLGRIDEQVKIRGFRIELGEIEQQLLAIDEIKSSVLIAKTDASGQQALVSFITVSKAIKLEEIKTKLSEHLPMFMIPSAIITLEKMPLTPNGKVDKKALKKLEVHIESTQVYVAPRDEIEKAVAQIYAQVLKIEKVGVHDNFFHLGGHSLLGAQLISLVRNNLMVDLPLKELFLYPTVEKLAAYIKDQNTIDNLDSIPIIEDRNNQELSSAQSRLWFLDQLEDGTGITYNIPELLHLKGSLNQTALNEAFKTLISRHESLRVNFVQVDNTPKQIVSNEKEFHVKEIKCSLSTLDKMIIDSLSIPFNLHTDTLIRADLYVVSDQEYYLLINIHHIISDGWSMGVFVKEFVELYNAFLNQRVPNLLPLNVQYIDYAVWERAQFNERDLTEKLEYWVEELKGAENLEFPTSYPRPQQQSFKGAHYRFKLEDKIMKKLHQLNRQTDTTLYMLMLSLFSVLLHRYSNQKDILIGTPHANRNRSEFENIIGFFVNTVVVRQKYSDNMSFLELLLATKNTILNSYKYQDLPFDKVVNALDIPRDLSRSPLFQVFFVLQNNENVNYELENMSVNLLDVDDNSSKFDLLLNMEEKEDELYCFFEYATDLFSEEFISNLVANFQVLIQDIVENCEKSISTYKLLNDREYDQLLKKTIVEKDFNYLETINQLFEKQVLITPNSIALIFGDKMLTYKELNERSNQLATYLMHSGVKIGDLVAIGMERSLDMIIGILAILKAGAAYISIDLSYPDERIQYIIEDAKVEILLANSLSGYKFIDYDINIIHTDTLSLKELSSKNIDINVTGNSLAYIIYTSGTTGRPKGILLEHSVITNLVNWQFNDLYGSKSSNVLQFASSNFDVSVQEIFTTLCSGLTLHLISSDVQKDMLLLANFIVKNSIDRLFIPYIVLEHLVNAFTELDLSNTNIKEIITAGEQLKISDEIRQFSKRSRGCKLYNHYGPSETHVVSSYTLGSDIDEWEKLPPIGKAISNTQFFILDEEKNLVPKGVSGELYISGPGLARGYLHQEKLSAKQFVDNPFVPGMKMYKSGDLVRYLENGNLEYLGRLDDQVKIRGFRIELGEIEKQILDIKKIKESVVLVQNDKLGDKSLVAYVVCAERIDTEDIRRELLKSLPEYMIPKTVVVLSDLPLTSNGKVDKKALLALDVVIESSGEYVAPRDENEEKLASIFSEVLKVEKIGIYDDFFHLGGHSLLATQLLSKIRKNLEVDVPLKVLFLDGTVDALACYIREKASFVDAESLPIEIVCDERTRYDDFDLSLIQQAYYIGRESGMLLGNTECYVYSELLTNGLDVELLESAWNKVIARHDMLRCVFNDDVTQKILPEVPYYNIVKKDLSDLEETEVKEFLSLVRHETVNNLSDIFTWPLVSLDIYKLPKEKMQINIYIDALICDAVSVSILHHELHHYYFYPEEELSDINIGFKEYLQSDKEHKETDQYIRSLDYWKTRLATFEGGPKLPLAKKLDSIQRPEFSNKLYRFSQEDWVHFQQKAQELRLTPSVILLALYGKLLATWSETKKFTLTLTQQNRREVHPQIDQVIGAFTSLILLEIDLEKDINLETLFQNVQKELIDALDHKDVGGVEILRLMREIGNDNTMPVIFTSTLGVETEVDTNWLGDLQYEKSQTPQIWLDNQVEDDNGELLVRWNYLEELFPEYVIEDLFDGYISIIRTFIDEENFIYKKSVQLMPKRQLSQRLKYNQTRESLNQETLPHQCMSKAFALPNHEIVVSGTQRLNYQQLHNAAAQTANFIETKEMSSDQYIAIILPKDWAQVVSVLACGYAGFPYLPIAIDTPSERVNYLLEAANVTLVFSTLDLDLGDKIEVVNIESIVDFNLLMPMYNIKARRESIAYTIFTSGSTGLPKGVVIQHSSVVNTIVDINQRFEVNENDALLAISALNFDLSVYDIYGGLSSGAKIVLPSEEERKDPGSWLKWIQKENITIWNSVPAIVKLLIDVNNVETELNSLRQILMSGDVISVNLLTTLNRDLPHCNITALGGATECSIWSIYYPIGGDLSDKVPYGMPLSNQKIYVLDQFNKECPDYVLGEICIAGEGLAVEYLHDKERTNQQFFTDVTTKERIYRTGDMGYFNPKGFVEILGRKDEQVKIQGYRVELGEIENRILEIEDVQAVVVLDKEDENGYKFLVAYVNARNTIDLVMIKEYLGEYLPDYMIPSYINMVDTIPLSSNGKIDKKALLAFNVVRHKSQEFVAPRDTFEEEIVEIFKEVLKVNNVGVHDNFFELGGNSLLVMYLIAKINKKFQVKLSSTIIFKASTVASLNEVIQSNEDSFDIIVPIQTDGWGRAIFAVPGIGGVGVEFEPLSRALGNEQPFYALQSVGFDGKSKLPKNIEEIAKINVEAIKKIQKDGPYRIIGFSFGGLVAFEMARILGKDLDGLVILDTLPRTRKSVLRTFLLYIKKIDYIFKLKHLLDKKFKKKKQQTLSVKKVLNNNYICGEKYNPAPLEEEANIALCVANNGLADRDIKYAWDGMTVNEISIYTLDGDHLSIIKGKDVHNLAETIKSYYKSIM